MTDGIQKAIAAIEKQEELVANTYKKMVWGRACYCAIGALIAEMGEWPKEIDQYVQQEILFSPLSEVASKLERHYQISKKVLQAIQNTNDLADSEYRKQAVIDHLRSL